MLEKAYSQLRKEVERDSSLKIYQYNAERFMLNTDILDVDAALDILKKYNNDYYDAMDDFYYRVPITIDYACYDDDSSEDE